MASRETGNSPTPDCSCAIERLIEPTYPPAPLPQAIFVFTAL